MTAAVIDRIAADVRARMEALPRDERARASSRAVEASASPVRSLAAAIRRERAAGRVAVIGEVKRRSPSAGTLERAGAASPAARARAYERGGACAISVLVEPDHFGGSIADLVEVRAAVSVPVLRKDVVVDSHQVDEARALGADAVLLMERVLGGDRLARLLARCGELGLDAIVEADSARGLARAVALEPAIIGINARDLGTLEVDRSRLVRLAPAVPPATLLVAESGMGSADDVAGARAAGAAAVLVGTALMRGDDPEALVREMTLADSARKETA